ncbi:MAG: hypothetical protein ACRDFS_05180 [Chloroflexota bacterium]
MTQDSEQSTSITIPIAAIGGAAAISLAAAAYLAMGRSSSNSVTDKFDLMSSPKGLIRKAALLGLVATIENSASRRALIIALKLMARRA